MVKSKGKRETKGDDRFLAQTTDVQWCHHLRQRRKKRFEEWEKSVLGSFCKRCTLGGRLYAFKVHTVFLNK